MQHNTQPERSLPFLGALVIAHLIIWANFFYLLAVFVTGWKPAGEDVLNVAVPCVNLVAVALIMYDWVRRG